WFLTRRVLRHTLNVRLPAALELNLALYLSGLLFFSTFERGEVWFWLSGSATYLWPLALALLGAGFLLARRPSAWTVAAGSVALALTAGFNESPALLIVTALAAGLCAALWKARGKGARMW